MIACLRVYFSISLFNFKLNYIVIDIQIMHLNLSFILRVNQLKKLQLKKL